MAVQTTLASLSQTAASNGPDGATDAPSSLDDAIRYALAFIAQVRDGNFTPAVPATFRSAIGFTSPVIDRAYAEYTANTNLATIIPADDTIPQNTEGTEILSVSFTPKSVTSRLRLRFQCEGATSAIGGFAAAFFSGASANALRATLTSVVNANASQQLFLEHEYVPGVTTALTLTVRVGPTAGTLRLNGNTTGRFFGGALAATLVVEEIAA